MPTVIRYIYSYISPYSYLADCRLDEVLAPFEVELDYMPVLPPPDEAGRRRKPRPEAESTYIRVDAPRVAKRFNIPFRWYPGAPDCQKMTWGLFAVRKLGGNWLAYHKAAFTARFADGIDPDSGATLRALAAKAGVDGDAFLETVASDEVNQAYLTKAREAVECGLFGVPILVLPSGERFWGQDRLDYLALALAEGRV